MDTQRLILFVIFSMSALFLWEAWQKEYRTPPPVVAATPPGKATTPAVLLERVPAETPPRGVTPRVEGGAGTVDAFLFTPQDPPAPASTTTFPPPPAG